MWDPNTALVVWRPRLFFPPPKSVASTSSLILITPPHSPLPDESVPLFILDRRLFQLTTQRGFTIPPYPHSNLPLPSHSRPLTPPRADDVREDERIEVEETENGKDVERCLTPIHEDSPLQEAIMQDQQSSRLNRFLKRKPSQDLQSSSPDVVSINSPPASRKKIKMTPHDNLPSDAMETEDTIEKKRKMTSYNQSSVEPVEIEDASPITTSRGQSSSDPMQIEDVFTSTNPSRIHLRSCPALSSKKQTATQDDGAKEQWRVGKRPGHQGSHVQKRDRMEDSPSGKTSLGESIDGLAERVLKKPFRPPKVILKSAKHPSPSNTSSHPVDSSPSTSISTSTSLMTPISQPRRSPAPFPLAVQSRSVRLAKPFKTPTRASMQQSPIYTTHQPSSPISISPQTRQSSSSNPTRKTTLTRPAQPSAISEKQQITSLENRARTLREALNLIHNTAQEDQLDLITHQWLSAGREIVERLFDLLPRPDPTANQTSSLVPITRANPWKSYGYDRYETFNDEQRKWLDHADRDNDGSPLDENGDVIMGMDGEVGMGALDKMLNDEIGLARKREEKSGKTGEYIPQAPEWISYRASDKTESTPTTSPGSWNYGSMMQLLSVDPALLGWNANEEDWD